MFPIRVFVMQCSGHPEYALCIGWGEGVPFAHTREIDTLAQMFAEHIRQMDPRLVGQCIHDPGVLPCLIDFDHLPDLKRTPGRECDEQPLSAPERISFLRAVHHRLEFGEASP